jgi:multiple sugar transport system ATP-binding protein
MVFQSYALCPHMRVRDNIAFPLKAQGTPRADIPRRVAWAAGLFGIEALLDRKPRQLSGGERQRVALARALVREPDVFLLDEPLSNLDAKLRASAREELQHFQRRIGTTTIYVTHDQVEAMGLGDRIVVMQGGTVRQIGTPQDVYDEPADTFVAAFLGSPPMNLVRAGELIVGFRPEHFVPAGLEGRAPSVTWPFRVTRVEYLGADRILYGILEGRFQDAKVTARLPSAVSEPIEPGQTYDFALRERDLKTFTATGQRAAPRSL